jgi:hypothetical protein
MSGFRKVVAVVMMAIALFWAPSVVPVKAVGVSCGLITWVTPDTAFAAPPPIPCPVGSKALPWGLFVFMAGAASVIVNSVVVGRTQCRELTSQVAITSITLPFFGIALNKHQNKCHRHR